MLCWGGVYCSRLWAGNGAGPDNSYYKQLGQVPCASLAIVYPSQWASLKTPQIENTVVSTFFITEIYHTKVTSEPHCIS